MSVYTLRSGESRKSSAGMLRVVSHVSLFQTRLGRGSEATGAADFFPREETHTPAFRCGSKLRDTAPLPSGAECSDRRASTRRCEEVWPSGPHRVWVNRRYCRIRFDSAAYRKMSARCPGPGTSGPAPRPRARRPSPRHSRKSRKISLKQRSTGNCSWHTRPTYLVLRAELAAS